MKKKKKEKKNLTVWVSFSNLAARLTACSVVSSGHHSKVRSLVPTCGIKYSRFHAMKTPYSFSCTSL